MSHLDRLTSYLEGKNALTEELKLHIAEFKATDTQKQASEAVFPWGKYKGRLIADVASFDRGYCEWLSKQNFMVGRNDRMGETITRYLTQPC